MVISVSVWVGAFTTAIMHYNHHDLHEELCIPFEVLLYIPKSIYILHYLTKDFPNGILCASSHTDDIHINTTTSFS